MGWLLDVTSSGGRHRKAASAVAADERRSATKVMDDKFAAWRENSASFQGGYDGRISRALTLTLTVYSAVFCLDEAQADDVEFSQLGLGLLAEPDYEADQADLWPAT